MKKYIHYARLCLIVIVIVMAFFFNGCSVFSPIGNAISQGYENMVSYFNAYYNAQRLFSDAEDEIKNAALLARGKEVPAGQVNQIPATVKQKLGQVIDKCSNILAFHSTSGLVDDALLLIGKSFFYQMEYVKAERKFAELLAQFPNSSLALEAQLWYARSEEKLGKLDAGVLECEAIVLAAQTSRNIEIETQVHQLLGIIYRRLNQTDKSIAEYEKAISISSDDDIRGDTQISLGDVYFGIGQYKKAAEVYLRIEDYTSDIYSNYYGKLQASIAYREIGEHKKGLTLLNSMIDDFRNREYLPAILFERANNYAAAGRREDAIDEYYYVDTTYARKEYAIRSAYQLGLIFEKELGLYGRALNYYSEVNAAAGLNIVAEGRQKFIALTRYFDAWRRLNIADSLLFVLSDTKRKIISDSLGAITSDSIRNNTLDTLNTLTSDSTHKIYSDSLNNIAADSIRNNTLDTLNTLTSDSTHNKISIALNSTISDSTSIIIPDTLNAVTAHSRRQKVRRIDSISAVSNIDSLRAKEFISDTTQKKPVLSVAKPVLPSADSLRVIKSIAAQELGDIFYSEIVLPDSAFYWYNKSLLWNCDRSKSPRILYILAELSRTNPEKNMPNPEEYLSRIDHDYPESIYAEEARRFLRKAIASEKTDTAAVYYAQSEKQIDTKQYEIAVGTLRSIIKSFPKSPFAAKSEYAIGWIMENHLAQPVKAIAQYKRIINNYKGTTYALEALKRYGEIIKSDTVETDTVKINTNLKATKPFNADSIQRNAAGLVKDTLKQIPVSLPDDIENETRIKHPSKPIIID